MNKYDEFLKSIIALGVRFGQENPNRNVEDVADAALTVLLISFKGKNPIEEPAKVKKQLEIAAEALNEYANEDHWCDCVAGFNPRQIDSGCYGVYGFQEAQEALMKIEELDK